MAVNDEKEDLQDNEEEVAEEDSVLKIESESIVKDIDS